MRMLDDTTQIIEGDETEALDLRLKPLVLEAIQHAAALSGLDEASFTASAAYDRALEVIETTGAINLTPADYATIREAIDNPRPPTAALIAAIERHNRTIISK